MKYIGDFPILSAYNKGHGSYFFLKSYWVMKYVCGSEVCLVYTEQTIIWVHCSQWKQFHYTTCSHSFNITCKTVGMIATGGNHIPTQIGEGPQ